MIDDRPLDAFSATSSIHVLKFGGTCLTHASDIETMTEIVRQKCERTTPVVVVSAAAGITDELVRATAETRADRATAEAWIRRISRRYRSLALDVLDDECLRAQYDAALRTELSELRRALQSLRQPDRDAAAARDEILSVGERAMAPLVAAALDLQGCSAVPVDATSLIQTDATYGDATVEWPASRERIRTWALRTLTASSASVPVITGFIGATADGTTTTLGRGGTDLSAAVLARGLEADRMERWTDTDGLYTRDPNEHEDARRLDELHFEQARIWTRAGRLGMHVRTLEPLSAARIPLHVRCIHAPNGPGTRIIPKRTVTPS